MVKATLRAVGIRTRRRDRRLEDPALTVDMDGRRFASVDWSLGGFRIAGYRGEARIGEQVAISAWGELAGRMLGGTAIATVVRRNDIARELAASFTEFRGDTWDQLEQLSVRRVRRS